MDGGIANPMNYDSVKEYHKNKMQSAEVRAKISNTMKQLRKEKGFSIETRNKISQKLKGNQHFRGIKEHQKQFKKLVKAYARRFIA